MVPLAGGFLIANVGFWSMFVVLARRRGLGSTFESLHRAIAAFREPQPGFERFALRAGPVLLAIGAVWCLSVVLISDATKNAACRSACREAGYKSGWMRGDPNLKQPDGVYRCWCFEGSATRPEWKAPVDLP